MSETPSGNKSKSKTSKSTEKKSEWQIKSFQRITSLPVVESATSLYGKVKDSSFLLRWSLKPAELSVWLALTSTKPFISIFPLPVYAADYILCSSLDVIEKRLPVVTYPPELVLNMTIDYVTSTFIAPVFRSANSVKELTVSVANISGDFASAKINSAVDVAEIYMDKYLPDTTEALEQVTDLFQGEGKTVTTINHINRFGRRLKRRLVRRTIAEAQALKRQGLDTINNVIYLAELLFRNPRGFVNTIRIVWIQLSQDEPENQIPPANLEQLITMIVRESSRKVVHVTNYFARKTMAVTKFTIDVTYYSFMSVFFCIHYMFKILHLEFIPNALLNQYNKVYHYSLGYSEKVLSYFTQHSLMPIPS